MLTASGLGAAAFAVLIHMTADKNREIEDRALPGSSEAESAEAYAEGFDITSGVFAGVALSSVVGAGVARRLGQ